MAPEIMRGHGYGTEVRMVQQRDGGFWKNGALTLSKMEVKSRL
jgi:hypothetical protein